MGETITAGGAGLNVQQFVLTAACCWDMEAQQLCSALAVCCVQIPIGATSVPINTMATAARWKIPCNMVPAYYVREFLR